MEVEKNIAKEVALQLNDQFVNLETKVNNNTILLTKLLELQASGGKKQTKSKTSDTPVAANGTAEPKSDGEVKAPPNKMNLFKQRYTADEKVREKYWKPEYEEAIKKDSKKAATYAKKSGNEKYMAQAAHIWGSVLTDADKKYWEDEAKELSKKAKGTSSKSDDKKQLNKE